MEAQAINHLDSVLPNSTFQFGEYIKLGFENWKKNAGLFIGFGVLCMVISVVISLIPFAGTVANSLIISPCLSAGAYYFSHNSRFNNTSDFGNFFEKFNSFQPILITSLIVSIISVLLFLPFIFSIGFENITGIISGNPDVVLEIFKDFNLISMLYLIPSFLLISLMGFAIHFIIFYDLSEIESLRYSVKFIFKHWLIYILFFVTISILAMSGVIGCGIGVIITYTFIFPMSYEAFRGLTQLDKYTYGAVDNDNILDMLIED